MITFTGLDDLMKKIALRKVEAEKPTSDRIDRKIRRGKKEGTKADG